MRHGRKKLSDIRELKFICPYTQQWIEGDRVLSWIFLQESEKIDKITFYHVVLEMKPLIAFDKNSLSLFNQILLWINTLDNQGLNKIWLYNQVRKIRDNTVLFNLV